MRSASSFMPALSAALAAGCVTRQHREISDVIGAYECACPGWSRPWHAPCHHAIGALDARTVGRIHRDRLATSIVLLTIVTDVVPLRVHRARHRCDTT